MTVFSIVGVFFFLRARMMVMAVDPVMRDRPLAQTYRVIVTTLDTWTSYPGIQSLASSLASDVTMDTFRQLQASSVPYIFTKDIADEKMSSLLLSVIRQSTLLRDTQTEIAKYGFLDPEIMSLLHTDHSPIPIITSLHTVETIKFGTALKMFSLLDTFVEQASRLLSLPKTAMTTAIDAYLQRGESDIARFLTMCYLNPYETLPDCKQVGDFANYFRFEEQNTSFDPSLFTKIMSLIDTRLEQSELPSLQIEFDRFTPNAQSLGFRVIVNTLPEDERDFLQKWIINPHIFIISQLVNLLKQSLFVIGDAINVNTLNIQRTTITIGDIQVPVSTSKMQFNLPLQNNAQREISDFYQSQR